MRAVLVSDFAGKRAGSVLDDLAGDPVRALLKDGAPMVVATSGLEAAVARAIASNRGLDADRLAELASAAAGPCALPVDDDGACRVYVSPTGDDRAHGLDASLPLATLPAAVERAGRAFLAGQVEDVEIQLAAGTYPLTEPLRLPAAPRGTLTVVGPGPSGLTVVASGTATGGSLWDLDDGGAGWAGDAFAERTVEITPPGGGSVQRRAVGHNGATRLSVREAFDPAAANLWTYRILQPTAVVTLAGLVDDGGDLGLGTIFADAPGYADRLRVDLVRFANA